MATTTTTTTTTNKAILSSGPPDPSTWTPGSNWNYTTISVPTDPGPNELIIEMLASGICHTDVSITTPPIFSSPRIVGHEGSGYVRAIGANVNKDVKVGDPVLLSFNYCGQCESCLDDHPAHCEHFMPLNRMCVPETFRSEDGHMGIAGKCFGQSSFAAVSVVDEASVLNVRELVRSDRELKLFAPLGCGVLTGTGAVWNLAKAGRKDRVMVLGLGGVGLSAVAAAAISNCTQIIGIDLVASRIELAKSIGATHGLNTTGLKPEDLETALKEVTNGLGPTVVIDTAGHRPLLTAALASLARRGALIHVGAAAGKDYSLQYDIRRHMANGTRILGCCEGDTVPGEAIPKMIEYYRQGKLPLDKMVKFYQVTDFKTALHDMHSGLTIKPVLTW